jgi:PPK2 family polyphosphate:nucleotide phosphotransferase
MQHLDDYLVRPQTPKITARVSPAATKPLHDRKEAEARTAENLGRLRELQRVLYAEGRRSLLIILQGMDTSGKDGVIRSVFSGINPQGCSVVSFKAPTPMERAHDFLWRIHAHAPAKGMIAIFNRSHYEDVLVPRVQGALSKAACARRYEHINRFEQMLHEEGTIIRKFFLHISKKEQRERLQERLEDPRKNWKFDPADLVARRQWRGFQTAYDEAMRHCSTQEAPWYIVPADRKWFRNWLISEVLVRTLEAMALKYPAPAAGLEQITVK